MVDTPARVQASEDALAAKIASLSVPAFSESFARPSPEVYDGALKIMGGSFDKQAEQIAKINPDGPISIPADIGKVTHGLYELCILLTSPFDTEKDEYFADLLCWHAGCEKDASEQKLYGPTEISSFLRFLFEKRTLLAASLINGKGLPVVSEDGADTPARVQASEDALLAKIASLSVAEFSEAFARPSPEVYDGALQIMGGSFDKQAEQIAKINPGGPISIPADIGKVTHALYESCILLTSPFDTEKDEYFADLLCWHAGCEKDASEQKLYGPTEISSFLRFLFEKRTLLAASLIYDPPPGLV